MTIFWDDWRPLRGAGSDRAIVDVAGLYRIRRVGASELLYIGQTGVSLRRRLGMLSGVWGEEMPYRDPHTAGPGLWATRQGLQCDFEASVCPFEGSTQHRLGLECQEIALYRQQAKASPTLNFGRMPVGYSMSSGNNAALVRAQKRQRGQVVPQSLPCHEIGIPPQGELRGDLFALTWCGHSWSEWRALSVENLAQLEKDWLGLYRLRRDGEEEMHYVGEGRLRSRLSQHSLKIGTKTTSFSYVCNDQWQKHQRLELECDLIGAHVLHQGHPPRAQFLADVGI